MQTSENVCGRAAVSVQSSKVTLPISAIFHAALLLNRWNGVRPLPLKLNSSSAPNKRCRVAAASKPMLLLPAREARRPKRDLLNNGLGDNWWLGIPADTGCICELGVKLGMR